MIRRQRDDASDTISTFLLNYTANADLLYNFYNNDIEAGAFIGLGVGGISYNVVSSEISGATQHGFDIGINFGLRSQFSHNHGIELFARVPFLPFVKSNTNGEEASAQQAFSLMMRYVYTYGDAPKKAQTSTQTRIKKTRKIKRKVMD